MKIIAVAVFLIVILLIISERVHRTAAAMAGAMVLILTGVMSADKALSYIDFNTIGVLVGMMIFVAIVRRSGMFEYIAVRAAKAVHGDPWKIMVAFTLITAVLSAILDNVTTVLLVGPMSIAIARMLKIDPVPFLMGQILASNVGGTATLIGDPPNIMIGSAAHLSFMDFLENTGFAVLFILAVLILLMKIVYEKKIEMGTVDTSAIEKLDPSKSITNRALMRKGIIVLICVIVGFMFHDKLGIESSVIALTAAAVMLIIGREDVNEAIQDVEWTTILFFMSLFVVVGGLTETGIIKELASKIINATDGHPMVTMLVLLWASALLSSILDNIPFVATMIPIILTLEADGLDGTALWWALSLGACLGGNGTLIGASANVVLSDISKKFGHEITFMQFFKRGFPIMLFTVAIAAIYMVIRFPGG